VGTCGLAAGPRVESDEPSWLAVLCTEHGHALPDRVIHDQLAERLDWELIFAMFHQLIPTYAV
jgi:hypothetical protein